MVDRKIPFLEREHLAGMWSREHFTVLLPDFRFALQQWIQTEDRTTFSVLGPSSSLANCRGSCPVLLLTTYSKQLTVITFGELPCCLLHPLVNELRGFLGYSRTSKVLKAIFWRLWGILHSIDRLYDRKERFFPLGNRGRNVGCDMRTSVCPCLHVYKGWKCVACPNGKYYHPFTHLYELYNPTPGTLCYGGCIPICGITGEGKESQPCYWTPPMQRLCW